MYHTFGVCADSFDIAMVVWARGRQQEVHAAFSELQWIGSISVRQAKCLGASSLRGSCSPSGHPPPLQKNTNLGCRILTARRGHLVRLTGVCRQLQQGIQGPALLILRVLSATVALASH